MLLRFFTHFVVWLAVFGGAAYFTRRLEGMISSEKAPIMCLVASAIIFVLFNLFLGVSGHFQIGLCGYLAAVTIGMLVWAFCRIVNSSESGDWDK